MRALRDPDAFLPSDLGVRHALEQLGQDGQPAAAAKLAERWRPYRAYALQHLWASLSPPKRAKKAVKRTTGTTPKKDSDTATRTTTPSEDRGVRKVTRSMPTTTMQTEHDTRTTHTLYTTMDSPIGELLLVGDGDTLSGLYMQDGRKPKRIAPGWTEAAAPFSRM